MALSLNNTVVARIAAALYGQQLGAASMTEALSEVSNLGSVEAWANQVFSRDFGTPTLALASKILSNVGVADDAKSTLATWLLGQMNTPKPGTTLVGLLNSFAATPAGSTYAAQAAAFNTQISAATAYASTYGSADETLAQAAVSNAAAAAAGTVTPLTTGLDTPTSKTITGTLDTGSATLQSFDSISSTAGNLNISDSTSSDKSLLPNGVSISGVNNVIFNTAGNAGSGTGTGAQFNTAQTGVTGVTQLTVNSSGAAGDFLKAASTTNVTENASGGAATIYGGNNVSVTAYGSITVGGTTIAKTPVGTVTASDTATASGGAIQIDGGTTVSVTSTDNASVTVGATFAPTGAVTVTDTGGTGAIAVDGGTSATVTASSTSSQTVGNSISVTGVTGAISASNSSVTTQSIYATGGTTVSATTTGGSYTGGTSGAGGTVNTVNIGSSTALPSGQVTVKDTFAGPNQDSIAVLGTGPVSVTTTGNVGPSTVINLAGTTSGSTADSMVVTINGVPNTWSGTSTTGVSLTSAVAPVAGTSTLFSSKVSGLTAFINTYYNQYGVYASSNTVSSSAAQIVLSGNLTAAPTFAETVGTSSTFLVNGVASGSTATAALTHSAGTAIAIGNSTAANDPTGAVSIANVNTVGATNYYGSGSNTIYTNGSPSVTVTGGGITSITDEGTVAALATVSLTGIKGLATITSAASTGAVNTVNITNSTSTDGRSFNYLGDNAAPTQVTISNAPATALTVNLNNDTNAGTSLSDAAATSVNVISSGSTASTLNLTATAASSIALTNNATGSTSTLTLRSLSDSYSTTPITVTVSGSGPVNLGNGDSSTGAFSNIGTVNASAATGPVTARFYSHNATTFTGGNSATGNTVEVDTLGATNTQVLGSYYGGAGTNDTLVLSDKLANYVSSGVNAPFSGFENLKLVDETNSYNNSYTTNALLGVPSGSYGVNGYTAVNVAGFVGANTGFTGMTTPAALTISANPGITPYTLTITTAVSGQTINVLGSSSSNNTSYTYTEGSSTAVTEATGLASFLNNAFSGSVFATASGTVVTINSNLPYLKFTPGVGTNLNGAGTGTAVTPTLASNPISYSMASTTTGGTLPITVSSSTGALGAALLPITINEANLQALNITSTTKAENYSTSASATGQYINRILVNDSTTATQANPVTTINVVAGSTGEAIIGYVNTDASMTTAGVSNSLRTINASAATGSINTIGTGSSIATPAVNDNGVQLALTGTIAITGGAGRLITSGTTGTTASETITTGSGGGTIWIGQAGQSGAAGTETVNLSASSAVSDIIGIDGVILGANANVFITAPVFTAGGSTQNTAIYGQRATVTSFNMTNSTSTADKLQYFGGSNTTITVQPNASGSTSSGGTYTLSNGIVTWGATESSANYLSDAMAILGSSNTNRVLAYTNGADEIVVATSNATPSTPSTYDSVITLSGDGGATGFGTTPALKTIVLNNTVTGVSDSIGTHAIAATSAATTYDETGCNTVAFGTGSSSSVVTADVATINNLAASAVLNIDSGSTSSKYMGSYVINQTGTAGSESLTLNLGSALNSTEVESLTINGDNYLKIVSNEVGATKVDSIVDATNSLTTLALSTSAQALQTKTGVFVTTSAQVTLGISTVADTYANLYVGETVTGTGIPAGDYIVSLDDSTHITLNVAPTSVSTSAGKTLTFGGPITRTISDTSGSTTVTTTGTTTNMFIGEAVSGTGIPTGAYITSIPSSTSFVISSAATSTNASITGTFANETHETIGNITSTSLNKIDASSSTVYLNITDNYANQTILVPTAGPIVINATGSGDTITQTIGSTQSGWIAAGSVISGNNLTVNLTGNTGNNNFTASGNNDTITLGTGVQTVVALGSNDTITVYNTSSSTGAYSNNTSANNFTVGAGAVVTLGYGDFGGSTVNVSNTVAKATTLSSGAFNFTTVKNAADGFTLINIDNATSSGNISVTTGAINVASATTLGAALDLAAANFADHTTAHLDVDWFQYGGDTYVLAHANTTGNAAAAMSTGDTVVKLSGLIDLPSIAASATGTILL